ncbi:MAG: alanine:cation symporter family protein, partial [Oscillospiraceae bacterium]
MLHLIETINSFLSGPIMVVSVLSLGVILSFKTRFIQFRKLGYTCKYIVSQILKKPKVNNGISPFQALTTALSGTIGTGNIVGVATAISMGGAGAVFWMWISAFLGMATKYAEIVLAIKYRRQDNLGQYMGGPMYYMNKA